MFGPEFFLILLGWAIAGGSPGPATLAISGAAMSGGRAAGLSMAAGVVLGSASWGIAAGLGMSAIMLANVWVFEVIRYLGAGYLLYLALKSLRSAWQGGRLQFTQIAPEKLMFKGFLIHITNPKAILSWGAIYAIALPTDPGNAQVWSLFAALSATSMLVFFGYGFLFSTPSISRAYLRMKRAFDLGFAALFGAASLRIFTARLDI